MNLEGLDILYDHYKETCSLSKQAQARRNKSFLLLCVLEAISFLILIRPEQAMDIINSEISTRFNTALQISGTVIQTLVWLFIVYTLIRYVQDMLYVERQYKYMEQLERKISEITAVDVWGREGENYQKDYPIILNIIDLFYKMVMPIFFVAINIVRICKEWKMFAFPSTALICDTIIFAGIFIISWFYFFEIHSKISGFCKDHIWGIDKLSRFLRRILKEV